MYYKSNEKYIKNVQYLSPTDLNMNSDDLNTQRPSAKNPS